MPVALALPNADLIPEGLRPTFEGLTAQLRAKLVQIGVDTSLIEADIDALDVAATALQADFLVEHATDGGHTSVTLDGSLTLSVLTPPQITADQNNYAPTDGMNRARWRLDTDATRTITGIAGGVSGRMIQIQNIGANTLNFAHDSGSSTAANRLYFRGAGTVGIDQYAGITLTYDGTLSRWMADRL